MQTVALPVVSALTAGVLIIVQMLLLLLTVLARRKARQSLGEGQDDGLLRAMRRHGNFAENAAIFVIALALLEMLGGRQQTVEAVAGAFVLGRLCHALGLSQTKTVNLWRTLGIVLTVASAVVVGVNLVMAALPHLGL
ncbi:MAG: MAPEG family protein [Proteobacteria bacterium]|nr:MAPEG family protein [Pseudomonadota bacterium]